MRRLFHTLALAAFALLPLSALRAQAVVDVRATCDTEGNPVCQTTPRSVFRVDDGGGIVAPGTLLVGVIPATGAGERMMWYPNKAAFRAGSVTSAAAAVWDDANVGLYSVAFGYNAAARGLSSFAEGYQSRAYGVYSTAMGYSALADGSGAIAIGYRATADADYSLAIGYRASANGHTGAMVFSDGSTTDSLEASANNQFNVRAAGGYRLYTNAAMSVGVSLSAGGSSWNVISDRNRKEDFVALDGEAVLGAVAQLPISTWHYRDTETTDRHIGPMAQDWYRLVSAPLALNGDSLTINQGDFDGVNLAGIQALEARTRVLAEENAALRAELDALRAERTADAARFARLEAVVLRLAPSTEVETVMATATVGEGRP